MSAIALENFKKIYFIGIGGIGMSALAKYFLSQGQQVAGSDARASVVTKKLEQEGVLINYTQVADNISADLDLIVYTSAVPATNAEMLEARKKNILCLRYTQVLGLVLEKYQAIAVCGTHGKSTTTAMAGLLLDDANLRPTVLVGSLVPQYESNFHLGMGQYFVVEACEYQRHFLDLHPQVIILNNIELDHTDYFTDIEDMSNAFKEFIMQLPEFGVVIYNGDDSHIQKIIVEVKMLRIDLSYHSFGSRNDNDLYFQNMRCGDGGVNFSVFQQNKVLGNFTLQVPGVYNVYNAMATIALGVYLEIPLEVIVNSLKKFTGIWRRFEIKGRFKNNIVVSDYAHHPTALRGVIGAAREFFHNQKVLVVFQPHQHNRTKRFYQGFVESFAEADQVVLVEIYDVVGREEQADQDVSSKTLARDVESYYTHLKQKVFYAANLAEAKSLVRQQTDEEGVILVVGAGDVYLIAEELVGESGEK